jgi:UDP-N-acetylmuramoyl-L-alanyl-D-glutamate--2,6-diaminopimelate ligase
MAALAIKSCDRLCLTSDNPRYEDPAAICEALRQGAIWVCPEAAYDPARLLVDVDRGSAIEQIIVSADAGDVVLIAGKGHENYQEVRGQRLYFDDCEHARQALARHWSLEVHA